jgi:anti-sigma-K factor RskA
VNEIPQNLPESSLPEKPASALCDEVEALIPAYSLGATDADETAFVQAHLAECPQSVHTLAGYTILAMNLLHNTPAVQPPPHLLRRLAQVLGQAGGSRLAAPGPSPRGWFQQWRWASMWAAAATTALLLLVLLNLYWVYQLVTLRQAYDTLVSERARQQEEENTVYLLLASDGRQSIELPSAQENSQAGAEVLWDPELNMAMLYAKDFPQLQPDQVYQLWLTKNGERQSGGLFNVDQNGIGVLVFPITRPLDSLDSMGITPEPAGGSPGPTSPPVVRRRFNQT